MWKAVLIGTTALAIAGSSVVYAQQRSGGHERQGRQFSQEDRNAFAAARIAGLKAGLALTPEQDKNWPAFEAAMKDLARYRMERRAARREARQGDEQRANPTERLRLRAEMLTGLGTALKKLADAQAPLYDSLDEAQKRRFAVLARPMRGHHAQRRWHRRHHRHDGRRGGEFRRGAWHHRGHGGHQGHHGQADRPAAGDSQGERL